MLPNVWMDVAWRSLQVDLILSPGETLSNPSGFPRRPNMLAVITQMRLCDILLKQNILNI
jgi:hypothetical protein